MQSKGPFLVELNFTSTRCNFWLSVSPISHLYNVRIVPIYICGNVRCTVYMYDRFTQNLRFTPLESKGEGRGLLVLPV